MQLDQPDRFAAHRSESPDRYNDERLFCNRGLRNVPTADSTCQLRKSPDRQCVLVAKGTTCLCGLGASDCSFFPDALMLCLHMCITALLMCVCVCVLLQKRNIYIQGLRPAPCNTDSDRDRETEREREMSNYMLHFLHLCCMYVHYRRP